MPISRLNLNGNDLDVSPKTAGSSVTPSAAYHLTKAFTALISASRFLTQLSLANCGIGKEVMLAIGEGLFKNTRLQVLNVRGNRVKLSGVKELVRSCF